jgi:hypothetical protein
MTWASEATNSRGDDRLLASTTKNYVVDIFRYWHQYETQSDDLVRQFGDWNYDSVVYRPLKSLLETMRKHESGLTGADIPLHLGPGDDIDSSIRSKMDHNERAIFPEQVDNPSLPTRASVRVRVRVRVHVHVHVHVT